MAWVAVVSSPVAEDGDGSPPAPTGGPAARYARGQGGRGTGYPRRAERRQPIAEARPAGTSLARLPAGGGRGSIRGRGGRAGRAAGRGPARSPGGGGRGAAGPG